jgi:hypothetical protein
MSIFSRSLDAESVRSQTNEPATAPSPSKADRRQHEFAPSTKSAPAFAGVRARPGQRYAVEWVKKRLRTIYREARAAGRPSPLNESAAHLYLLVATYILDRRFVSESMQLQELVAVMHCDVSTVTRSRKLLTKLGELKLVDGGQGKSRVRFELLKMAGPLYAENGGREMASTATSGTQPEVPSGTPLEATSGTQPDVAELPAHSRKFGGADISCTEEEVPTTPTESAESDSMTADEHRACVTDHQVHLFCQWWPTAYAHYNDGVQNRVRSCDRDAAFDLLRNRTLKRVQDMAIELWTLRGDYAAGEVAWLRRRGNDRSIRVLLEKETMIEKQVAWLERREQRAGDSVRCPHQPMCETIHACVARTIAEGVADE